MLSSHSNVFHMMLDQTDIERLNKALIAFTLLTSTRDGALASIKLKHVNLIDGSVFQDVRDISTKFSKNFIKYFFLMGKDFRRYLKEKNSGVIGFKTITLINKILAEATGKNI